MPRALAPVVLCLMLTACSLVQVPSSSTPETASEQSAAPTPSATAVPRQTCYMETLNRQVIVVVSGPTADQFCSRLAEQGGYIVTKTDPLTDRSPGGEGRRVWQQQCSAELNDSAVIGVRSADPAFETTIPGEPKSGSFFCNYLRGRKDLKRMLRDG